MWMSVLLAMVTANTCVSTIQAPMNANVIMKLMSLKAKPDVDVSI